MDVGLAPLAAPCSQAPRRSFAAVGERYLDDVVAAALVLPPLGECGRSLVGGVRTAQLVGSDDDPHPRRTVSRGALGSILGIARDAYIWEPTADVVEHAHATAFMREHGIADWRWLIQRSQADIEWFWDAAVRFLGLEFFQPYEHVLDMSRGTAWATWFTGGTVNLTHNCVDRHPTDHPAVVWESEDGTVELATYGELAADESSRRRPRAGSQARRRGRAPAHVDPGRRGFYAARKIGAIVADLLGLTPCRRRPAGRCRRRGPDRRR